MWCGLEPQSSLHVALLRELGSAIVTAAVLDVLLFPSFERFKKSLSAPFVEAAIRQRQTRRNVLAANGWD